METKGKLELFEAIAVVLLSKDGFSADIKEVVNSVVERGLYNGSAKKIEQTIQKQLGEKATDSEFNKLFEMNEAGIICLQELLSSNMISIKQENELLWREIKGLKFQYGINKTLLGFHEGTFAAATADFLINPNPILVHGTAKGKGIDYPVSLNDIIAIDSYGRIKNIYLKKGVIPEEGGKAVTKIADNIGFDQLLFRLQGNGHHLLRVNESFAINIYHYTLSEEGVFHLIDSLHAISPEEIKKIKTDKKFDNHLYHTRLMEIDRLSKMQAEFSIHLSKIEEINRYKNQ